MNVMQIRILKKLGNSQKDLKETNMRITNFIGESTKALGIQIADLTIRSKTSSTAFFVVDAKHGYSLLLEKDWIHMNHYVPSTLHQQLIFWHGDRVEVVLADQRLFLADVKMMEAMYYVTFPIFLVLITSVTRVIRYLMKN